MIVVDASVLIPALADDGVDGDLARSRLLKEDLAAPELIDLEVLSFLRRKQAAGLIDERRSLLVLSDLVSLPIDRARHISLLDRIWQLRRTVTACDAAYVALAEALDVVLLTADARLAGAPGPRCRFDVLASG